MIKEITMPAGGQTTDTSTIGSWLVQKGDCVNRGDALLEIETDKATLTVESFAKGIVLELLKEAGDQASAGEVIAYIGEESDRAELAKQTCSITSIKEEKTEETEEEDEYQPIIRQEQKSSVQAMPNAKLLARDSGIELAEAAKNLGKSILKRKDIEAYCEKIKQPKQIVPHTAMRKTIAHRMLLSSQNIPSYHVTIEVKMQQCIELRHQINSTITEGRISYNDIFCKCVEAAIRKFPHINASWSEEGCILHEDVNIGLAVSVPDGLLVPVVKKVGEKGIVQIAEINRRNIASAKEGTLSLEQMSGGTITISNLGMYPVVEFDAIINPPEVCILAVGSITEQPVFEGSLWGSSPVMRVTGTFDHRVIDGAYAAEFLTELKKIVEYPALALL